MKNFASNVGVTHWERKIKTGPDFINQRSGDSFFAPSQLQKALKEWGMKGFETAKRKKYLKQLPFCKRVRESA